MKRSLTPAILAAISTVALSACSGGAGGMSPLPLAASSLARAAAMQLHGNDQPDKAAATNVAIALNAASISLGSKSVTVMLTKVGSKKAKGKLTTNLSKCTKGCTVPGPQSAAGKDVFSITIYDGLNGKGNALATGPVTGTVKKTKTTLKASLKKNVKSVAVAAVTGTAGTATPATALAMTIKDADGNAVVGTYVNPVTLTDSDASGATTLSGGNSGTATSQVFADSTHVPMLAYSGLAIASATLTPSAAGASTTPGTFSVSGDSIHGSISPAPTTPDEIDLYATSGTGSSSTLTLTQPGWTGSFAKNFTYALGGTANNCTSYSVTPASGAGSLFTVSAQNSAAAGTCILTATGGAGMTKVITLTYTTNSIGVNGKPKR
jgi:hypothetical protein